MTINHKPSSPNTRRKNDQVQASYRFVGYRRDEVRGVNLVLIHRMEREIADPEQTLTMTVEEAEQFLEKLRSTLEAAKNL